VAGYSGESLHGKWVHSHEEDTDDEMVFRPSSFEFPPARGRESFELRPDGSYVGSAPGPVDVPEPSAGKWTLEGDRLFLTPDGDGPGQAWQVTGVEPDRLTVKR
jgi:hypothetical protein